MAEMQNKGAGAQLSGIRFERALGVSTSIGAMSKLDLRQVATIRHQSAGAPEMFQSLLTVPRKQGRRPFNGMPETVRATRASRFHGRSQARKFKRMPQARNIF
jgi:hypothetical protein